MGGFDLVPMQDAIVARVREIAPNTPVYEDTIPDDEALFRDGDTLKVTPSIILRFSPLFPGYERAMAGPRHDSYLAFVDILAVSANGRISRQLNAAITSRLIGFKPDGIAPLHQNNSSGVPGQFTVSQNEMRPTLSVVSTRLRWAVNNSNIGAEVPIPG